MSEIVVGDVLAWEPRLRWCGDGEGLARPLSWAVAIHARIPALPPMRGDELVLVNGQTIEHLKRVERVAWSDITRLLSAQPMAGLVVEDAFDGGQIHGVPLIRAERGFFADGEAHLNRTITERRGELYRLGSDLSRALSTASIAGADLDALFAVAGDVGRSELILFERSGHVLGRSRRGPSTVPFPPEQVERLGDARGPVASDDGHWLIDRLAVSGPKPVFLACASVTPGSPEITRLVLGQTARAIEAFLERAGNRGSTADVPSRDSMLTALLLGEVAENRLESQSRLLGIDSFQPLRVLCLLSRKPDELQRLKRRLPRDIRKQTASLSGGELAVLDLNDALWANVVAIVQSEDSTGLVRSETCSNLGDVSRAVRQARALGRLWRAGLFERRIIDADELGRDSYMGLILSVAAPDTFEPRPARLNDFVTGLLGTIAAHDAERNSELLRTLEGYLAAGGSTTGAADLLGVHRNTLAYRLTRISDLTGSDLNDADTRLALGLALKIRAMQRALAES